MHTVTSFQPQGRNRRRVNLFLDGGFAFALSVSVAQEWGLSEGKQLSEAEVAELKRREQEARAMASALRLLSYRPRSEAEVRGRLARHGVDGAVTQAVVSRLAELQYLDDVAFAESWRRAREGSDPRSPWVVRRELRSKGVSQEIADEAVAGLVEEESAYRAAQKGARKLARVGREEFRKKLTGYLAYRGFTPSVVRLTVQRLWQEREEPDR